MYHISSFTNLELKAQLEEGRDDFTASARKRIEKYFVVSRLGRGGRLKVSFNEEAVAEAYRYFGYFALVGNQPLETFEAREDYRLREKVKEAFADQKGTLGVWSSLRSFRTPRGFPLTLHPRLLILPPRKRGSIGIPPVPRRRGNVEASSFSLSKGGFVWGKIGKIPWHLSSSLPPGRRGGFSCLRGR